MYSSGGRRLTARANQLNDVTRTVERTEADGKQGVAVALTRTHPTDAHNLWDALTNPTGLLRWFAPVTGDLKLNGRFLVENNASSTITACKAPYIFAATWEFGENVSWIAVNLVEVNSHHTRLELTPIAHPDEHWNQFGPGVGRIGWDLSLLGLVSHFEAGANIHEAEPEWDKSDAGIHFITQSGQAWIQADVACGECEAVAKRRGQNTINFYTGVK